MPHKVYGFTQVSPDKLAEDINSALEALDHVKLVSVQYAATQAESETPQLHHALVVFETRGSGSVVAM